MIDIVPFAVPLGFFVMIAYIVRLISNNRLRRKVLNSTASEEMADTLLRRRSAEPNPHSALKWGLVLVALGVGVLLVSILSIGFESPMAYAILLLAAGMALVGFYVLERNGPPFGDLEEPYQDEPSASSPEPADLPASDPVGETNR